MDWIASFWLAFHQIFCIVMKRSSTKDGQVASGLHISLLGLAQQLMNRSSSPMSELVGVCETSSCTRRFTCQFLASTLPILLAFRLRCRLQDLPWCPENLVREHSSRLCLLDSFREGVDHQTWFSRKVGCGSVQEQYQATWPEDYRRSVQPAIRQSMIQ